MKPPRYIRSLTSEERRQLTAGLRSSDAFTLRRCQILLASARGQRPAHLARQLGCATQSVRNAIHAFHTRGLAAVHAQSRRPRRTRGVLDANQLRALLHERPRAFGKPPQLLDAALSRGGLSGARPDAIPSQPRGDSPRAQTVACELAAGQTLDQQPRSPVWLKKKQRDRLMHLAAQQADWVLGFADETWWSRLAHPALRSGTAEEPLRLVEQVLPEGDPSPKPCTVMGCCGLTATRCCGALSRAGP